ARPAAPSSACASAPATWPPDTAACSSPATAPAAASDRSSRRHSACVAAPAPGSAHAARRCHPGAGRSAARWRSSAPSPAPVAHSAPDPPDAAPASCAPVRSPLFSQGVLDDVVLEQLLGQQLLQPRVLGLQLLEPLGLWHAHAAKLAAPQVVGGLAKAVLAAQLLDRQPRLGLTQEADDLFLGKALLHVQSPSRWGLDSKSLRYSKAGGRRSFGMLERSPDCRSLRMQPDAIRELFDQQAAGYDRQWEKTAPIRQCLHFLLESAFAGLPEQAHVLCVGVGTGVELAHLARRFPGWRFTAVDPSAAMLEVSRQRAQEEGFIERCRFHAGFLETLPDGPAH